MKQKSLTDFVTGRAGTKRVRLSSAGTSTIDNSKFGSCPLCQLCFPVHVLIAHAEMCDGTAPQQSERVKSNHNTSSLAQEVAIKSDHNTHGPSKASDNSGGSENIASNADTQRPNAAKSINSPWWTQRQQPAKMQSLTIPNPLNPSSEPIPGLHLHQEFITREEEAEILAELDGTAHPEAFLPWQSSRYNGRHRGKRWGVHCNLRDRRVGPADNPMPPFFYKIILPKLQRVVAMKKCTPNEGNAIDYHRSKGDYLEDHVDDRQLSKEPIANLSIGGDCYMTFINQKKKKGVGTGTNHEEEPLRVLLPRRTLQVLTGNARYDYSHGIRNIDLLDDRRVSVTMRESPLTIM